MDELGSTKIKTEFDMYEELVRELRHYFEGVPLVEQAADVIEQMTPPIAIGTPVYFINFQNDIERGTVSMIQQKADRTWKFRVSENGCVFDRVASEIGKSVFLTYAEAEYHLRNK